MSVSTSIPHGYAVSVSCGDKWRHAVSSKEPRNHAVKTPSGDRRRLHVRARVYCLHVSTYYTNTITKPFIAGDSPVSTCLQYLQQRSSLTMQTPAAPTLNENGSEVAE